MASCTFVPNTPWYKDWCDCSTFRIESVVAPLILSQSYAISNFAYRKGVAQNRNVFKPRTEEYSYIWNILHYAYDDVYDEFIHA